MNFTLRPLYLPHKKLRTYRLEAEKTPVSMDAMVAKRNISIAA
jgi:hypothetical protein